jgi:hypothetical protein
MQTDMGTVGIDRLVKRFQSFMALFVEERVLEPSCMKRIDGGEGGVKDVLYVPKLRMQRVDILKRGETAQGVRGSDETSEDFAFSELYMT